jgi:hypothetical protein
MANRDDFDRFVGHPIEDLVWVPNKRGGPKPRSFHGQRRAFRPFAQARDDRLNAPFKGVNERWEIGWR